MLTNNVPWLMAVVPEWLLDPVSVWIPDPVLTKLSAWLESELAKDPLKDPLPLLLPMVSVQETPLLYQKALPLRAPMVWLKPDWLMRTWVAFRSPDEDNWLAAERFV